jgi:hypothetical protein
MHSPSFKPHEIMLAILLATGVQVAFFAILVSAGSAVAKIKSKDPPPPPVVPIAVKPVIDEELPLLKLGGKRVRYKLPDMWTKQAPIQRYEEKSAPSAAAEKTPEAIPTSPVALGDAAAPPPDAALAKQVDEFLPEAGTAEVPNVNEEGSPDGVKEGTETDPLKARAVSQYTMRILAWFNARFRPPLGELTCEELVNLSSAVVAQVGGERTVTGYSIVRASGNAIFDARVRATMEAVVGQELPPPPPLYPDILDSTVRPTFSGKHQDCTR